MRIPRYAKVVLEFESGGSSWAHLYIDIVEGDTTYTPYALVNAPATVLTPEYILRWVHSLPGVDESDWQDYDKYRVY